MVILCTIDLETREVSLPAGQVIASYDHNVDVIRFQAETIPGFSLDTSSIKVAAQGPNKARHDYAVDPSTVAIEEETGYITFDWPIPAGVTEMPIGTFKYGDRGQLIFAVCAEIISGSTVSKAWHSDDGIITVVAHLEPESGGGEDPSEIATNAQKIGQLQTDVAVVQREVAAVAGGTPTVVDAKADMTEHDKIYILSSDGKWYYYSATAEDWLVGGTYGGATTSTTFNQHGVPADDFAVGEALADKANSSDVTALDTRVTAVEGALESKADTDDVTATNGRVSDLEADLSNINDVLNIAENLFDATTFEISNTSNWAILSKTKTSLSVENLKGFSTGYPKTALSIPAGDYILSADFSQSAITYFQLYKNGSYSGQITNGSEFTVEEGASYELRFVASAIGTYTITEISIKANIGENEIDRMSAGITSLDTRVSVIEDDRIPIYSDIEAVSTTENQIITNEGAVVAAGSNYYLIAKYTVESGKDYLITGSSAWGNLIYAFYDSSDALLLKGTRSATVGTDTVVTQEKATAPTGVSYLLIAYHTSSLQTSVCKGVSGHVTPGAYSTRWAGKKWVCVGDSLTAINDRTTKHYFDYVADSTGITVVNMGLSGTGYARRREQSEAFYQRISDCPTDADVVTIFGSFNDIGAGLPVGSVDDTGTDTLAGCINTTITNLQSVIPLVNLGIVAPTPWDTTQPPATVPPAGQLNAYNYVEMLKSICARQSIPFLDLWRESNLRPWDADFRALAYSKDGGSGTHPDENGHKLIAPRFEGFLETLLM